MPELPSGVPAPDSGVLPASAVASLAQRDLGLYVHVPFCSVRCGYCDFNTYTPGELGERLSPATYLDGVAAEARLAREVLGPDRPAVATVFVGGGTPTLIGVDSLGRLLSSVQAHFPVAEDAEVTVESNPDSVSAEDFDRLVAAGVSRISFGVQSTVPRVLRALDRTHDPDRVGSLVAAAKQVGLQVSVDLIYGAPSETAADWRRSLQDAIDLRPDHVSAYALVVEPGTRLAAEVRRGAVGVPDDDVLAERYEFADQVLAEAGYSCYEISNWAASPQSRCRHNLGYWTGQNWWGLGPGAHSHIGGIRWWNVKHPAEYAGRLAGGRSPAAAREELSREQQRMEELMLRVRLAEPWPLPDPDLQRSLVADGLVTPAGADGYVLTRRGRLLADSVARAVIDADG